MPEHVPNRWLMLALWSFFWSMAAAALAFWVGGVLWPGGPTAVMAALGPGPVAAFLALHIPAAITGILLLQWRRRSLPVLRRVLLEAATLYFGLAVLFSIFLNYLLVSVMQDVIGPVIGGGAG